jgi:nitroreductase
MRKKIFYVLAILIFALSFSFSQSTGKLSVIKLNKPRLDIGKPLMQVLKLRKTERNISDKKIPIQQLSDLLWAANGINRDDGKRTAPAAMGKQSIDIYVVMQEGIYLFDAVKSELTPVAEGDYRKLAGRQDFVYIAPVNLVYVYNSLTFNSSRSSANSGQESENNLMYGSVAAGCQAQNVYLYCASEGLGATVRALVSKDLFKVMKLKAEQTIVIAETIGYPK